MLSLLRQVRSAENGSAFIDRVKELCELDVEIISGEEEAEIGILGALGEKVAALSMWAARVRKSLFARAAR